MTKHPDIIGCGGWPWHGRRCWCGVVHPAGWEHASGAQSAFRRVTHLAGEEDDQPHCWTTDDAPWGTETRITHNPARVTCQACQPEATAQMAGPGTDGGDQA